MAGRRGVGRPPTKRTATAATVGKSTTRSTVGNGNSLSSLVQQQEQQQKQRRGRYNKAVDVDNAAQTEEMDVTLVYRKAGTRTTRTKRGIAGSACSTATSTASYNGDNAAGDASGVSSSSVSHTTVATSPEQSVLSFLQRAIGPVNLSRYLFHCAVQDVQLRSGDGESCHLTQQRIFQCSSDRLETAVQALWNMEVLIVTPTDTSAASGAPWVGHGCWVAPQHQEAMVALARVCEAAVPLQLPSLVDMSVLKAMERGNGEGSGMTWTVSAELIERQVKASGGSLTANEQPEAEEGKMPTSSSGPLQSNCASTLQLVPSPVRLSDVHRRLRCLHRLQQLRVAYNGLLPRLYGAKTLAELCATLFNHDFSACQALGHLRHVWMSSGGSTLTTAVSSDVVVEEHFSHTDRQALVKTIGGSGSREADPVRRKTLIDLLTSYLGNPAMLDTLVPLVDTSSRHPQGEALLRHLVDLLNEQTAVEAATWGPMAAMSSWRCTDGIYVVQHAARVRVLRKVIGEAQFYGLPRFLRSIRVASASGSSTFNNNIITLSSSAVGLPGGGDSWMKPTALLRAQSRYTDQFLLTPDTLDPASFAQPDPIQAQLVQEELITLQRAHCAFCLLVGEADEIVSLAHRHLVCSGSTWQHLTKKKEEVGTVVKAEPSADGENDYHDNADEAAIGATTEEENNEGGESYARARTSSLSGRAAATATARVAQPMDPLRHYVLLTVDAARRHEREKRQQQQRSLSSSSADTAASPLPFNHVQWVEGGSTNRWSPNTHYYGLVYMVVLETDEWETDEVSLATEGLLPGTAIPISEDGGAAILRPPRPPTYCLNAMLELWRS